MMNKVIGRCGICGKGPLTPEQEREGGDLYVIFDGPPDHDAPRFVEVENAQGKSVRAGEWIQRPDGLWALVIKRVAALSAAEAENAKLQNLRVERHEYETMRRDKAEALEHYRRLVAERGAIEARTIEKVAHYTSGMVWMEADERRDLAAHIRAHFALTRAEGERMSLPKCEHGVSRNDGRFVGLWNAPFSECGCCGVAFPYIDSASDGPGGAEGTTWTPKDRCAACGGGYVKWDHRRKP